MGAFGTLFQRCLIAKCANFVAQKADGSLGVMVESLERRAALDTRMLSKKLFSLTEGYPVTTDLVGEIPSLPSGKHRWIVSERKNELRAGKAMRS